MYNTVHSTHGFFVINRNIIQQILSSSVIHGTDNGVSLLWSHYVYMSMYSPGAYRINLRADPKQSISISIPIHIYAVALFPVGVCVRVRACVLLQIYWLL